TPHAIEKFIVKTQRALNATVRFVRTDNAPTKKAYRIYNKRTRKIQETVHVAFDELTEGLTSVQTSSGLAPC
ncbi:hypothetical protein Tco_0574608, partial [Tanacetum coccineum]